MIWQFRGPRGSGRASQLCPGPKHAKQCTASCFVHYYKNCKLQYLSVINKMDFWRFARMHWRHGLDPHPLQGSLLHFLFPGLKFIEVEGRGWEGKRLSVNMEKGY